MLQYNFKRKYLYHFEINAMHYEYIKTALFFIKSTKNRSTSLL